MRIKGETKVAGMVLPWEVADDGDVGLSVHVRYGGRVSVQDYDDGVLHDVRGVRLPDAVADAVGADVARALDNRAQVSA